MPKNFLQKRICDSLIISLIFGQFIFVFSSTAYAADLPITPDGTTITKIDYAINGVPIVNIATPNAGGLSHNKFENYNVNPNGLILNNAIGSQNGVIQTQIGGLINDNANLVNSGAASIILNEVTSNNISQINGYTEIGGKKADLVLANPNGFVFNGSGFINVNRLTAIVGSSNQLNCNPDDLTFRLSDNAYAVAHGFLPKLTIVGSGIDLENITSTDLVANVMNIVAPVYGGTNDVNLKTGDASFNYLTKATTSDNATSGNNLPDEVAIDASALGKIQAGRIFIVATKEGFGIKYSGDLLASRAGITIDNQGNIDYNNIASEVGDISITSQKASIVQRGISQTKNSASDITLNAFGNISNYGQFLSARNINLKSTFGNFSNQSNALNLSNNDFTISAIDFTNLGQISANRDLDITANNQLTNSAQLVGGRNLSLRAPQIINNEGIYANNKITIIANDYLTNNKEIISVGLGLIVAGDGTISGSADDGIIINAKTLNNNRDIKAKNNITINSNDLNNNMASSLIHAFKDVNLNAINIDNSNANIESGRNLTLRNLILNSPEVASNFGITSQATSITNTGGTFYAGTFLDFDLGNTDYAILGKLESAGNAKIKAVNITNKTYLKANGAIEIIANDKFTNGILSGDNSNNKIAAGTALSIVAVNLLGNYGVLSSNTDLTLTSINNNINNNINAEIIGGTGKLSLVAKNGTINQNSLQSLVSNGNLALDVTDFDNTGRVDVAGNLTLNVANNLTNSAKATIYAGGNMELNVVNTLTNNSDAAIYSEGNLTIQKYAPTNSLYNSADNKTNLVKNISAKIISYGGNMQIDAKTIDNERAIQPFNSVLDPQTKGTIYGADSAKINQYSWQLNNDGCFGHECENKYSGYYAKQLTNSGSIASLIESGGTLIFNAGTLNSLASNIAAVGNITVNADILNNHSINDLGLYYMDATWGDRDVYSLGSANYIRHDPGNGEHSGSRLSPSAFVQNNPSIIKTGGRFINRAVHDISNGDIIEGKKPNIDKETPQYVNGINVADLTKNGSLNLDLTNYFSGPDNQGLFTKNPNPNRPLFETRSQFIDQGKFFGSDYFYQRIGLNLTDVQTEFEQTSKRLVGDQFFQHRIISEQLTTITKNSFLLSASETNVNNEIKSLLDNAADEYTRLGLNTNKPLTQTQINSLQKDIVWFETQIIDGATYIVPKIYLTQATRNNLKNGALASKSSIYAGGDIEMTSTSGKITNAGSIVGNNVALSSSGDILNKNFSNITAINALSIASNAGSISNFSQLKAGGAASLNAAKDITNSSTVLTNDSSLLASGISGYTSNGMTSSGFIQSTILETAGVTAGSLTVNAGNDFNNYAANITTTGNANITAGNNANFKTLELRNRTETSWGHKSKGGSLVTDTIKNIDSNVNVGGNFNVTSTGLSDTATTASINIIGSNVNVAGNSSLTSDFGNVNIVNAIDSKMTEETASKSGAFYSRSDSVYDYKETAAESKLNIGGNLAVNNELGTMNLTGSTIKTGGDLNIGSFTVAQNTDGSYKTNSDGTFQTINGESVAGVNIKAAELRSEHSESHSKSKLTLGDTLKTLANPIEVAKMELNVAKFMLTPSFNKATLEFDNGPKYEKTSSKTSTATTTQHSATLDVGGNMMVNSTGDVNIVASDVSVAGNALMNVDGNINIASATETNKSSNQTQSIEIGTMKLTRDIAHASASAGVEGIGSRFEDSLATTTQKSSNINIGGSMLANVTNNAVAANSGNMTLAASNLTVGGDSIIKTAGDFNLTDAQETSSYSNKESTLTVEAGAKVGNAYVDAAYAWKAVLDTQKKAIDAVEKLKKMERLQDEGKATSKAVELAAAQVVLAQTAVATATIAAATATAGAASAASTSLGTGFYGAGYLNTTATGIKNSTETSISKASNFIGNGDIDITSNNNINVLGSILASDNGNVNLGAAKDIKIEAGTNTFSQNSKQETIYGGGSVGNNGVQLNIGLSSGESNYNKTSYSNSQINAENGNLTLTTGNDANISGANLIAKNVAFNIGNNLNVSSKQTEEDFSSSGYGFNFGVGVGAEGNSGNIGGGFNISNADMHRLWVDNITTIKGTDSMVVNVVKDLNLTGAAILSNDLALVVTGNTNKKDINDSYYSESMGIGVSTNFTTNGSQPTITGTGGQPNQFPVGLAGISGNYAQNESSRTVYATIGKLDSALTSATKDVTSVDFEGRLTIDNRLLSEGGRNDIVKQLNYSKDLAVIPIETLSETYKQQGEVKVAADGTKKGGGTNFIDSLDNKYFTLQDLMFNPELTAKELAPDSKNLIAYNGNEIPNSATAGALGFYDRKSNTSAINIDKNQSDSQLAGSLSHENYHAQIDNKGIVYSQAEENTAHNIGDFTQSRWDTYQSGNTNFQSTLLPTVIASNNSYANSVVFGNEVNPLVIDKLANAIKPGLGNSMNNGIKNFKENSLNNAADKYVSSKDPIEKAGLAIMLGVGSVALPESVTDLELSAVIGGVSKVYATKIAAGANKIDDAASGLWNKLVGGSAEVANPIPETFARVIPGNKPPTLLGPSSRSDVFVTDAKILEGLTPSEISHLLKIEKSSSYSITTIPSQGVTGIATPINRTDPGFVGGGRTVNGAPEFVIPNGPIPNNATTKIVTE